MGLRRQHTPRYKLMLQRLRRTRLDTGLTQAEVAKALGTTQAYVSKSESGERRIDAVELYDFARVYGAPLETLLPTSKVRRLTDAGTRQGRVAERPVRPGPGGRPKRGRRSKPK
jgi:transcriptional regulator with XRE-family HTH domain